MTNVNKVHGWKWRNELAFLKEVGFEIGLESSKHRDSFMRKGERIPNGGA